MNVQSIVEQNQQVRTALFKRYPELSRIREAFSKELKTDQRKGSPVIATGHQPVFYYPGILLKNFLADKIASETGGVALNFVVDTDSGALEIPVPCRQNHQLCKNIISLKTNETIVHSGFQPTAKELELFFDEIKRQLDTLNKQGESIRSAFRDYRHAFMQTFTSGHNFTETLTKVRSEFEKTNQIHIQNYSLSGICKTTAYQSFILFIIQHINTYREHFNQAIEDQTNKEYQPVKKLTLTEAGYELPLWLVKKNQRYPVFARQDRHTITLRSPEANETLSISTQQKSNQQLADELRRKATIYPKAPALTFLLRIFLSDLFIHGTGGVEYEKINNQFLSSFFGLDANLQFLSATGTIYLPIEEDLPELQSFNQGYRNLKEWIKEYQRNPEDLLPQRQKIEVKEQKKALAGKMQQTNDSSEKKALHNQMEALNQTMRNHLKKEYQEAQQMFARYEKINKKKELYLERTYPWFFYPDGFLSQDRLDDYLMIERYQ